MLLPRLVLLLQLVLHQYFPQLPLLQQVFLLLPRLPAQLQSSRMLLPLREILLSILPLQGLLLLRELLLLLPRLVLLLQLQPLRQPPLQHRPVPSLLLLLTFYLHVQQHVYSWFLPDSWPISSFLFRWLSHLTLVGLNATDVPIRSASLIHEQLQKAVRLF